MKDLTFRVRSFAVVALLLAVGLGLGLFVTGCGDDGDGNKTENKTKYADLVITHNLIYSRGIDTGIAKFVLNGYNDEGAAQFSTTTYNRTTTIRKSVPVTTKSIRISYLDKDDNLVGLYVAKVALRGGAAYEIDDPAWQDADSQSYVQGITMSPDSVMLEKGNYAQFTVMARMTADGEECLQDVTDETAWILPSGRVVLVDEGHGNILAYNPGVVTLTANYLGATADSKVTVLSGEGDYSVKANPENVKIDDNEPDQSTYWLPLNAEMDFPGAIFRMTPPDVEGATVQGYFVKIENTDIVTFKDGVDEKESKYALFTPKALGTTTAFIYYNLIDNVTGEETTVGVNLAFKVYNGSPDHMVAGELTFETDLGRGINMELWQAYNDDATGEAVTTYVSYLPYAEMEQDPLQILETSLIHDKYDADIIVGVTNRTLEEGVSVVSLSGFGDQDVMVGDDVVGQGSVDYTVTVGPHVAEYIYIMQYLPDPDHPGEFIACDKELDPEYGYTYFGISVPTTYYYKVSLVYSDALEEDVTANAEVELMNFAAFMGTVGVDEQTGLLTITPLEDGKGYEFLMRASLGATAAPTIEVIRILE